MSNLTPPPIQDNVVDQEGFPSVPWSMFFNNTYLGDMGTEWTPSFTNLTQVGTPTITGNYKLISRQLVFFRVHIVPATNTTSTAGSTAVTNFPMTFTSNGFCLAVSGNLGGGSGMVSAADNRIYVPSWTAVTVPLTVLGLAEVG